MKLIYIANIRLPTEKAHGIQIMKMCEAFAREEVKVELIVPRRFNFIKEDPFEYYGVERNFKIKKLPCLDLIPLEKILGRLAFWIEAATFSFFVWFYLIFRKSDIIYTRDKFFLPSLFFGKKLIYEVHTFPKKYFLYSSYLKKTKGIIVITEKLKNLFLKQGVTQNKILVAPDGVDLQMFNVEEKKEEYRKEFNLPQNKKIIGYVGRLETMEKEKGIDTLIKAFRILSEKFNNLFLCIVGGPKERIIEYENLARQMKIKEKVKFLDQVRHALIPKLLKSFDILVMPYPWTEHYAFYMSPLKLFEYMASKRPIIASDLPSIREILNENNAILVKPDNPGVLAQGIKKVLQDPELFVKISNQAFKDVQNYTWRRRTEKIIKFINLKL